MTDTQRRKIAGKIADMIMSDVFGGEITRKHVKIWWKTRVDQIDAILKKNGV